MCLESEESWYFPPKSRKPSLLAPDKLFSCQNLEFYQSLCQLLIPIKTFRSNNIVIPRHDFSHTTPMECMIVLAEFSSPCGIISETNHHRNIPHTSSQQAMLGIPEISRSSLLTPPPPPILHPRFDMVNHVTTKSYYFYTCVAVHY